MPVNLANAVYPGALANYIGCTIDPHTSSSSAAVALNTSQYNLGLVRVSPTVISVTNPMFGNSYSVASSTTKVVFNVTTASVGATHSWAVLFDMSGTCQAVTADGGATQWSLGLVTLSFVGAGVASGWNLVAGGLYYIALFNNGGTAPKLSGISALLPEHTAGQSANVSAPYGFATNATSPGTTPPAVGPASSTWPATSRPASQADSSPDSSRRAGVVPAVASANEPGGPLGRRDPPTGPVAVSADDHRELAGLGRAAGQRPGDADSEPLQLQRASEILAVGGRRPVLDDRQHRPGQVKLGVPDRQRHEARGADKAITDAIDAHVDDERHQDDDGDGGPAAVLVPAS